MVESVSFGRQSAGTAAVMAAASGAAVADVLAASQAADGMVRGLDITYDPLTWLSIGMNCIA